MGALEDDLTEHHRMRTIEDLRKDFLEIEALRKELAEAKAVIANLDERSAQYERDLAEAKEDAEEAEAALEAANARIAELEEQLQKCWQRNLKLSNATTARAERAEAEADSLRATVDNMRVMNIKLTFEATGKVLAAEAKCKGLQEASHRIGFWLSAALEDPGVCDAMKADIHAWFAALNPSPAYKEPSEPFDEPD